MANMASLSWIDAELPFSEMDRDEEAMEVNMVAWQEKLEAEVEESAREVRSMTLLHQSGSCFINSYLVCRLSTC